MFLQLESDPCRAKGGRQNKTQEWSDCLDSSGSRDNFIYAGSHRRFGISMIHPDELTDHVGMSKTMQLCLWHIKGAERRREMHSKQRLGVRLLQISYQLSFFLFLYMARYERNCHNEQGIAHYPETLSENNRTCNQLKCWSCQVIGRFYRNRQ